MTSPAYSSSSQWYCTGQQASYVRARKSHGEVLELLEVSRPAGDMSRPGLPDIVLYQDLRGGCRVIGDLGGGYFDLKGRKGSFIIAAPNFSTTAIMDESHYLRSLAFPVAQWQSLLYEATDGRFSFDSSSIYGRLFDSLTIQLTLRKLWVLAEEEGVASRLLARAAGCEIMAELCRLDGTSIRTSTGGLSPSAERRCIELMRARLSDDISLEELAAEAQLSSFHFARMFKESVGVPPLVYLRQLRVEKVCELLEYTDLPITKIAFEVGYSSNQVLARVFARHLNMSPSDYRSAVRDPIRRNCFQTQGATPIGLRLQR